MRYLKWLGKSDDYAINGSYLSPNMTIGKIYKSVDYHKKNRVYLVINDKGDMDSWCDWRFTDVTNIMIRKNKLKRVLNEI